MQGGALTWWVAAAVVSVSGGQAAEGGGSAPAGQGRGQVQGRAGGGCRGREGRGEGISCQGMQCRAIASPRRPAPQRAPSGPRMLHGPVRSPDPAAAPARPPHLMVGAAASAGCGLQAPFSCTLIVAQSGHKPAWADNSGLVAHSTRAAHPAVPAVPSGRAAGRPDAVVTRYRRRSTVSRQAGACPVWEAPGWRPLLP
jgi:hypothetical protein